MNEANMNGLTQSEWKELEQSLLDQRSSIVERLRRHEELAREAHEGAADESDLASEESERSVTLRLLDKERKLLRELDTAILKLKDETYGLCEGSGEPIGFARLKARPWARYSLSYKEELETQERGYARG